jgi:hypothetical protein
MLELGFALCAKGGARRGMRSEEGNEEGWRVVGGSIMGGRRSEKRGQGVRMAGVSNEKRGEL